MACPFGQFDGDRFYDSEYVRDYRKKLLDYVRSGASGLGIHIKGEVSNLSFETMANYITVSYSIGKIKVKTIITVCKEQGVIQNTALRSSSTHAADVDYTFALNVSVNRASYGQLTEGGPFPIPPPKNEFQLFNGNRAWAIINPNLNATIQGSLRCDGLLVFLEPVEVEKVSLEQPLRMAFHGKVEIFPGQTRILTSTYRLRPGSELATVSSPLVRLEARREEEWKIKNENMKEIIKGNLSYILGNCTIPVSNTATCLVTDHVALPLGWNRDN